MGELRIVGTAHVSRKSVEEVRAAMEEFRPDVVAVELDPARFAVLKQQEEPPAIADVLKSHQFTELLVQWTLAHLQRRIGMEVGVEPGAEIKAAIQEAEARHLPLALVDRDIRVTLNRFWHSLSLLEKLKMGYALAVSLVSTETQEIDVEELTRQDVISLALQEFRKFSPRGAQALIDERDAYLALQLLALTGRHERVLAIVGAGHVEGIRKHLAAPETIPPPESLTGTKKGLPYGTILGVMVLGLFALLVTAIAFSGVGIDLLVRAFVYWVVIHGVLAAGCALLAGGHPLSALTAFAVSWMTALHPLIAAGWFTVPVEARIRKPTVADFRRIMESETFTEMREVPLFRVILVAALTNVGSMLGTFLYFVFIFPALGIDPGVLLSTGLGNAWGWMQTLLP
ncbi:MAG: TraB/GumN family protein [Methanomicrobiales archaeon]|nr:TraB/GumN family protein [Methanomicrobiales archaeon]MDD1659709.1 TraB/GumN family protein [Methanomicrobiales archaeon]